MLGGRGYLTVAGVADLIQRTPKTVYHWIKVGRLPEAHAYDGVSPRWDKKQLEAWIQAGKANPRRSA